MNIVRFRVYREYEQRRVEANNAVMALLAGAGMASHMLRLTEGSKRLLPEILPRVAHIERLNLRTDAARGILTTADVHLGAMAVPYVLALHEDYLRTCLELLQRSGTQLPNTVEDLKLAQQHEAIQQATGRSFNSASLQQLHTLRLMRNCAIHAGGRTSRRLVSQVGQWDAQAEAGWVKVTGRSPRNLSEGSTVTFGHGEVLVALAVAKVLARETNQFLQTALPRDLWVDLLIEDLVGGAPNALAASDASRRGRGLARFHYGALGLTDAEISAGIARAN